MKRPHAIERRSAWRGLAAFFEWMSQTAAHLFGRVIPHVPLPQWVGRADRAAVVLATQPELVTPVLQVQRVLAAPHQLGTAAQARVRSR